jgi:F-type H+-transporting ATPase subunit delta
MLAREDGNEERFLGELSLVSRIFIENPDYIKLLDTPAIPTDEKPRLIDGVFSDFHPYICNFIKMLCEKRSVWCFERCKKAYFVEYDEYSNIIRAEAITAHPMTEAQKEALKDKLGRITGKNIVLENTIDKSVIGGVRLRYSGRQLDGSVKSHLEALRRNLAGAVV